MALLTPPAEGFNLDLDSTVFNREGHQEGGAKGYNPRRTGRKSHHPLLGALAEAPFNMPAGWRIRTVRADSGFFDQALLAFLQERGLPFIIVARMTTQIKARLNSAAIHWREIAPGYCVATFTAKLRLGGHPALHRRARDCARGQGVGGTPPIRHAWLHLSTLGDQPQRATLEQRIEELESDMRAGGFCAKAFYTTEAAFLGTILA